MNSPALGARVTIVRWRTDTLCHAEVWGHQFAGSFQWSDGKADGFVETDTEGVHWARGWLQDWTEEARALLAAHKLARSQET